MKRELSGLDSSNTKVTSSTSRLGAETEKTAKSSTRAATATRGLSNETDRLSTRAVQGTNQIDRYSGRLTVLAQVAAGLGPSLIPIAAVGVPAIAGLVDSLGAAALGAGTTLLAFHGLSDALTALNKAALDPSVTNLQAAHEALLKLPPAARDFARELQSLQPTITKLREAAAAGLFPGLTDSIGELATRSGQASHILNEVGIQLGDLAREGGKSLAGPEWDSFFRFIAQEAPVALANLGHAIGQVVHGMGQLVVASAPLNQGFIRFVNDAAEGFDRWASGLARTQGYSQFIAYLREEGPKVAEAVTAIANAVLQIAEAAAPLGGPVLQALTAVANAVAVIANSPIGPVLLQTVTALSLLSRAQAVFGKAAEASWVQALKGAQTYQERVSAIRGPATKAGLALTGLGIAASGAGNGFKFANTASLAMTGSIAGPWGAAVGAGVGLLLDFTKHTNDSAAATADFTSTLNQQTGAITQNTRLMAAQTLQQDGAFKAATQLGLSLDTVTSAALGNKQALAEVNDQLAFYLQQNKPGYSAGGVSAIDPTQAKNAHDLMAELGLLGHNLASDQARTRELASAMGTQGDAAQKAKGQNYVLRRELLQQQQAAQKTAQQFRQFGDNLNDAKKSLDQWIRSLANQAQALTEFGNNAETAADKGLRKGLIQALQQMGPEGALRMKQLANATQEQIAKANRAWGQGKKATEDYQQAVAYVNQHPPQLYVKGVPQSLQALRQVAAALDDLRSKTIEVTTKRVAGGHVLAGQADGGTVRGSRAPYGDRVLTMLAPGEEVISNRYGQADQHRALLKAINSRRYADGGTVAMSRSQTYRSTATTYNAFAGADIDYGRLAAALANARPLYGDVHMQPHNYSEFKRQMEEDHRMAVLSGVRGG